jgi:hypothetical protein
LVGRGRAKAPGVYAGEDQREKDEAIMPKTASADAEWRSRRVPGSGARRASAFALSNMLYAKKVVLHCPRGYEPQLAAMVEDFIRDGGTFVGVVGPDCAKVEDIIDELVVPREP